MENEMNVFLYSSEIGGKEEEVLRIMDEVFPEDQPEVLRSVENLAQKLQEPWEEKPIVIILASEKSELLDFVSMREQLHSVRLILILPDAEEGTISLAHQLRPNYLTYVYRNSGELKAVLQKMSGRD
jgi:hypothetical protein